MSRSVGRSDGWTVGRIGVVVALLSVGPTVRPSAAQCPDGSPLPCRPDQTAARRAAVAERTPSLTVLYLENLSPNTADAELADGVTEELIVRLTQLEGIEVTSRYASLRYRGRRLLDPRQVSRELGVRYVLQGTLRRARDRVRVTVEITDATRARNLWAATYDQPLQDVLALQDSVAVQVAVAVRGRLTGRERAKLAPVARTTPEAYQAYLAGRAAIRQRTALAGAHAVAQYRRAVAFDPPFAAAHGGLAHAYILARIWGWDIPGVSPDTLEFLARESAQRALALDSSSGDSWLAAAMATRLQDPRRALAYNRRAVAVDSTNIEALHQLGWSFYAVGQMDSAIATVQRVTAHDPYFSYAYAGLGELLNMTGHPIEALAWTAQGMAIDSTLPLLHYQSADADLRLGRLPEAESAARRALELGAPPVPVRSLLALVRIGKGDTTGCRGELEATADSLRRKWQAVRTGLAAKDEVGFLAGALAQLGDADSAIVWLERIGFAQRRFDAAFFEHHWLFDPIRDDPRFQRWLAELR